MTTETLPEQIGKYRILGELGRGAMGVVFRGHDPDLSRDVAVKVLPQGSDAELRARFLREGRTSGRLRHPGIVAVHETGEANGWSFIVQELIEGKTLRQAIANEPMSPHQAAAAVEGIARALAHAHAEGVIHRDVKPGNVLLDGDGAPHLTDFGLARDVGGTQKLSVSGTVIGTPEYMSPEQAEGRLGAVDGRTDIWACGVVLYELVAGRSPFAEETPLKILTNVLQNEPAPVSRFAPGVSRDFTAVVAKCLRKDAAERYAGAGELADDLARFLRGEPVMGAREGAFSGVRRSIRRNPAPYVAAAVVAVAVAGAAGWIGAQQRAERAAVGEQLALARDLADTAPEQALGLLHSLRERAPDHPMLAEIETAAAAGRAAAQLARLQAQAAGLLTLSRTAAARFAAAPSPEAADDAYRNALAGVLGARNLLASHPGTPEYRDAGALMADLALEALTAAEGRRDAAAAARFEADLRTFGTGTHDGAIRGEGRLSLRTEPAGAAVELIQFEDRDGILAERALGGLGVTPLEAVTVPRGSLLLVLRAEGYAPVRLPVLVARTASVELPAVRLLTAEQIGAAWIPIPGGPTRIGGDPLAPDALPTADVDVPPFLIARDEVTIGEFRQFLQHVARTESPEAATAYAPLDRRWTIYSDGSVRCAIPETHPVQDLRYESAERYAEWRAEAAGLPIRLPSEHEWVRAARGADGREFIWGSVMDWSRCLNGKHPIHDGDRSRQPIGTIAGDRSLFGVRDMAGSVKEFTTGWFTRDPDQHAVRGGGYSYTTAQRYRCAGRWGYSRASTGSTGIRLARDWPK